MSDKKYRLLEDEFIDVYGTRLYRIVALSSFANIKEGDKGGFVSSENNIDQYGNARVYGDADLMIITNPGSRNAPLTACRQKDGTISFTTGCFYGTEEEFLKSIKERHGDNQYAQQYRAAIGLIKLVVVSKVPKPVN